MENKLIQIVLNKIIQCFIILQFLHVLKTWNNRLCVMGFNPEYV